VSGITVNNLSTFFSKFIIITLAYITGEEWMRDVVNVSAPKLL